jgi:CRP/FNR family cyclic AMP-dependent transcriptional regulator
VLRLSLRSIRVAGTALPLAMVIVCFALSAAPTQATTTAATAAPVSSDPTDLDALVRTYATVPSTDDLSMPKVANRRKPINWPFNILGYLASALVFATFWMKLPMRLRQVAIASNVVFIAYAAVGHLYPILILHATLLPLNVVRLREIQRVAAKIQRAATIDVSADWLRPMSSERTLRSGEYLFRAGDEAGEFYYIVEGTVILVELNITLQPGDVSGFLGLFSPAAKRTMSARCTAPVELLVMDNRDFLNLYYNNPDFGMYLSRMITRRFLEALDIVRELEVRAKVVEQPA